MNSPNPVARPVWPLAGGLALGLMLMLVALFWPTAWSMIHVWERSETFAHGFLIFPISAWLVWRRRQALARIAPHPDWRGVALLALAGAGWLLADAGSVAVVAQYALVTMLIAAVWSVLGLAVVRALLFPLLFLYFAVPVGEFLIPPMMTFTADFTVAALQLTGIPVYREGTFFSIPSGDWSVVEGCSGLRYLIASVTLGTLYAYLTYRSPWRRVVFALASFIVPVFANGLRAYMIVMIAHLSDMKLALGVDHYIYGWVWFGVVMLAMFWVGSFWREDEDAQDERATPQAAPEPAAPRRTFAGVTLAALLAAAIWPAYAAYLERRALPPMPALAIAAQAGWQPAQPWTDWTPHWIGADRKELAFFAQDGARVLVELDYYVTQRQDRELINSQNFMVVQKHPVWSNVGEAIVSVDIDGRARTLRQAKLKSAAGQRILVWQWNVIDGQRTVSDPYAKLVLAFDRVRLSRDDGASILIAAPYDEDPRDAAAVLARFLAANEAALMQALQRVAAQ